MKSWRSGRRCAPGPPGWPVPARGRTVAAGPGPARTAAGLRRPAAWRIDGRGQGHRSAPVFRRPGAGRAQRPVGLADRLLTVRDVLGRVRQPGLAQAGGPGRPQAQRFAPAPGPGAQVPADIQAVDQQDVARPRGQLQGFPQLGHGLSYVAGPQLDVGHGRQAFRQQIRGARLPGGGQRLGGHPPRRAGVPHLDRADGHIDADAPRYQRGDPGRVDLLCLPPPGQFGLVIPHVALRACEVVQRGRLAGHVAEFPGHGQRAVRLPGRLGQVAGVPQRARPPVHRLDQRR
jgi:hypothetical protein